VIATVEPPKPNVLKRAVGSIPGLGFLKKPKTEELDSPATVARRVQPARFDDTSPVRVKVKIGTDGYVKSAHLLTTSTTAATASSVMRAAREWRFTPAKQANRPVESEMVLTFQPEHGGGSTL
jgi:TonB family protein